MSSTHRLLETNDVLKSQVMEGRHNSSPDNLTPTPQHYQHYHSKIILKKKTYREEYEVFTVFDQAHQGKFLENEQIDGVCEGLRDKIYRFKIGSWIQRMQGCHYKPVHSSAELAILTSDNQAAVTTYLSIVYHSKRVTFTQFWVNVGPAS